MSFHHAGQYGLRIFLSLTNDRIAETTNLKQLTIILTFPFMEVSGLNIKRVKPSPCTGFFIYCLFQLLILFIQIITKKKRPDFQLLQQVIPPLF